ncbi:LacI family transcriptional regulator [Nocardia nova]|uniref:LacI family transcriptional regulator n=1 Tax=Nocardia nova TaxID=37330 RepID=A0A2S6AGS8_9NOCA|nr:LacI family DNA-binding transcriptional regulator [Nocardia nova]PPJ21625.1 LacI family transcriptional regulator [Nocardia nova]PPJ33955.1 LacI family transcriptional regulator [Nocardia nova]
MEAGKRQRRSALSDVASLAGVSQQTVSRVVNGHPYVADRTRRRVQEAIATLGYRPNTAARALATGVTRSIGLVTFNIGEYGPAQTMLGLERAARAAGYSLTITVLDEISAPAMQEAVERLVGQSVDAVIVLGTYAGALDAVQELRTAVPVVSVRAAPAPARPTVWVDQEAGARMATRYLLDLGHATVHHVAGPPDSLDARQRLFGWEEELRHRGIDVPEPLPGDWTAAAGYRAGVEFAALLSAEGRARPTAVFVANDQMALGLLKAVQERGISVPGDLSVIGFDDLPESGYFLPALSTVRQDFAELGRCGVQTALDILTGQPHENRSTVPPLLVVRDSTAPPVSSREIRMSRRFRG